MVVVSGGGGGGGEVDDGSYSGDGIKSYYPSEGVEPVRAGLLMLLVKVKHRRCTI